MSTRRRRVKAPVRPASEEWLSLAASSSPARPADWGSHRPCACIARGGAWSRPCAHPTAGMPLLREATGAGGRRRPADRRAARPDRRRVDLRGGQGNRRSRGRALRARAQRGDLRRRNGGGDRYGAVAEACSPPASWAPSRLPRPCCRRCGRRARGASCWSPARPGCAVSRPPRRTRRPREPWSGGASPWRARSRPSVSVSPFWWPAHTTPTSSPTRAPSTIATSTARTPGCTTP